MLKKIFRQMSVAQIISSMTVILCLLIDSIMIGRFLGVTSMAAYGLSNPLLLSFAAIGSMISAGVQVLCSKSIGSGDQEGTNASYSMAVAISACISFLGVILVVTFRGPLSQLLGAGSSGELFNLTSDYLLGFILGAPAFLFSTVLVPFMQLAGKQNQLVAAVGSMIVADIVFDLLNVFVFHGGMLGMGIASSLSYYIAFGVGISYFFRKDCLFHFSFRLISWKKCRELLHAGIPTVINMISMVLLSFTLNQILLSISGNVAVAAYSIIATVSNICYAFCSGFGSVVLMLSGIFYSEEDRISLYDLVKIMVKNAIVVDAIVLVVVFIISPVLVLLFLNENEVAFELATWGTRLFVLSLVISSINSVLKHFYQGTGRIRLAELLSVLQNYACPALFSFILSFWFGTTGVWLGYLCGESLVLLFIILYVWKKNKRVSFSASSFSILPDDFGVSEDNCLSLSIRTNEEVSKASKATYEYCEKQSRNHKLSYYASLCIEEMCNNILAYGFCDNKKHTADIRIFLKHDELIIRIRDDCASFDPMEYANIHNTKSSDHHLGIHMIFSLAKSVNYTNSMSLNNLMIVLDAKTAEEA